MPHAKSPASLFSVHCGHAHRPHTAGAPALQAAVAAAASAWLLQLLKPLECSSSSLCSLLDEPPAPSQAICAHPFPVLLVAHHSPPCGSSAGAPPGPAVPFSAAP